MDLSIRSATVHDAQEIARIHVASWQTTYPGIVPQPYIDSLDVASRAESWKARLDAGDMHMFVAEDAGGLIGFVSGGAMREPVGEPIGNFETIGAEIYAIYLLSSAQRRGAGKLLMRSLAAALRTDGFTQAAVWVLADNPSCGFYEHLGGRQIAQKTIRMGDADLLEVAYGWQDIGTLGER